MATRATIRITDRREKTQAPNERCYYNHWDWYPLGLGRELIEILENGGLRELKYKHNGLTALHKLLPKKFEDIKAEEVWNMWDEYSYEIIVKEESVIIYYKKTDWQDTDVEEIGRVKMYEAKKHWEDDYYTNYISITE